MQVLLDLADEIVPAVIPGVRKSLCLNLGPNGVNDNVLILSGIQLCDLA